MGGGNGAFSMTSCTPLSNFGALVIGIKRGDELRVERRYGSILVAPGPLTKLFGPVI